MNLIWEKNSEKLGGCEIIVTDAKLNKARTVKKRKPDSRKL